VAFRGKNCNTDVVCGLQKCCKICLRPGPCWGLRSLPLLFVPITYGLTWNCDVLGSRNSGGRGARGEEQ